MNRRPTITVLPYDATWPRHFEDLRDRIWPAVQHLATAIEHVGSTSVPGLSAKPVIDLDIVIPHADALPAVIQALETLGYEHRGDLGIAGREAFRSASDDPRHNLYVCPAGSLPLRNHLTLRDHLRAHPSDRAAYSALKLRLAEECSGDMDRYVEGKTEFILSILAGHAFPPDGLDEIRLANRAKGKPNSAMTQ